VWEMRSEDIRKEVPSNDINVRISEYRNKYCEQVEELEETNFQREF
jgi:hypothetical protein